MTAQYEPYGVYVVVETEDKLIVKNRNGELLLPFSYGLMKETPQKCARRIIENMSLSPSKFIKSLPYVERNDIESVPLEVRKEWPIGAKTIPIYWFSAEIDHLSDDLLKDYTIIKKEEALEKIEKYKYAYKIHAGRLPSLGGR